MATKKNEVEIPSSTWEAVYKSIEGEAKILKDKEAKLQNLFRAERKYEEEFEDAEKRVTGLCGELNACLIEGQDKRADQVHEQVILAKVKRDVSTDLLIDLREQTIPRMKAEIETQKARLAKLIEKNLMELTKAKTAEFESHLNQAADLWLGWIDVLDAFLKKYDLTSLNGFNLHEMFYLSNGKLILRFFEQKSKVISNML